MISELGERVGHWTAGERSLRVAVYFIDFCPWVETYGYIYPVATRHLAPDFYAIFHPIFMGENVPVLRPKRSASEPNQCRTDNHRLARGTRLFGLAGQIKWP